MRFPHPFDRENELTDSPEQGEAVPSTHNEMSRRDFLRSATAASAAAVLSAVGDDAFAQVPGGKKNDSPDADNLPKPTIEAVEGKEGRWIVRKSDVEKNGEGYRGLSFIAPSSYALDPITLTTTIDVQSDGGPLDHHYLLNIPRDFGESARHQTEVAVISSTGLKDKKFELTLLSSEPNSNQFLSCRVQGTPTGEPIHIVLKSLSWITHPGQAPEGPALARTRINPAVVQSAQTLLQTVNGKLTYDASKPLLDLGLVTDGRGDCGTFSQFVKHDSNGTLEFVAGYLATPKTIEQNGGMHAWNVSTNGNFRVDGAAKTCGLQSGPYIATAVGTDFQFQPGTPWVAMSGDNKSLNGCYFVGQGGGVTKGSTTVSIPGLGVDGAYLRTKSGKAPPEVMEGHKKFMKERKDLYMEAAKKSRSTPKR